ncbi:uncharacterized protein LOC133194642 [Saccostrea echinata]|uniref:uncharacterized protein LOC133194642 n=1 Tax=Saccostrea echinata TaxID=191078 RepID=UPI002A7F7141|nr:uncharacterized protein LOC133194642 [Saccostrea echinata]
MACSSTTVKFMKSVSLILDIGTLALSYRLKVEIQKSGLNSFRQFLNTHKHKLFHLHEKRNCCRCTGGQTQRTYLRKNQWSMLFNANLKPCDKNKPCLCQYDPQPNVSEDDLDLTLLCSILQNICSLSPAEYQDITNLRDRRNIIAHSKNAHMDDATYVKEITAIKDAIESIANRCGKNEHEKVKREIENVMKSQLNDNMGRFVLSSLHNVEETTEEIRKDLLRFRNHFGIHNAKETDLNKHESQSMDRNQKGPFEAESWEVVLFYVVGIFAICCLIATILYCYLYIMPKR